MALNLDRITLVVRIKEDGDLASGAKKAKEIALEFFHKCTNLSMTSEFLDAEFEETEEIDGKEAQDVYFVTYEFNPKVPN